MTEEMEKSPEKLSKNWRITLNILFFAIVAFVIGYKLISHAELKTTSALFIGLPMLMGLLIVNLSRTNSTYGMTVKANLIILCLVAPLLGEGSICILMMAPIFLAVSLFVVFIFQKFRKKRLMSVVIILPFFMGPIEKNSLSQKQIHPEVTTETIVEGTIEEWNERINSPVFISEDVPTFLDLGFPLPTKLSNKNSELVVEFDKGGFWKVEKTPSSSGINYKVLKDTSKISRWVNVKSSNIKLVKLENQKILIKQTTTYQSKVFPKWYFEPLQKLAFRQLHQFAISSWKGI